jgi:hypothetical protein
MKFRTVKGLLKGAQAAFVASWLVLACSTEEPAAQTAGGGAPSDGCKPHVVDGGEECGEACPIAAVSGSGRYCTLACEETSDCDGGSVCGSEFGLDDLCLYPCAEGCPEGFVCEAGMTFCGLP